MLIHLVLSMTILMLQWQGQVVVTSLNDQQSLRYFILPIYTNTKELRCTPETNMSIYLDYLKSLLFGLF